jgi:predicted ATPase
MICKKISDIRLLVIGTYRSDDHAYFYGKLPEMSPLEIKRFSQQEVEDVAISIVGEAGKRHGIAEFLYAHTEGNAFFVIEALRSLAMKAGKLEDIGQIDLPSSLFSHGMQDIVERRLSRLSEHHRMVLRYAAIIGKEIHFDLLTAILGKFDDNNLLLKCVDADIFRFIEGKWYFSHDKLREGIIHSLPDEQRHAMHQQITRAISQIYGDNHQHGASSGHLWSDHSETH